MQVQIQVLLVRGGIEKEVAHRPNIGSNIEVAKLQIFNGKVRQIPEFLTACKLYIRMRMREVMVEE